MKKILKRSIIGLGILLLLLLAAAVIIPYAFHDKLMAEAKRQIAKHLNATADFKDVSISLFRHFPELSVGIDAISIVNKAPFAGDTLIAASTVDISLDLMKAIKGDYDIRRINILRPRIHALVHADGAVNWNIAVPDTVVKAELTQTKPLHLSLKQYGVEDGYILYNDDLGKMHAELEGLNHSGSGDFTDNRFTLATKTSVEALSFAYGNIAYLNKAKFSLNTGIGIDNKTSKYSFSSDGVALNGMKMEVKGFVQLTDTTNTVVDVQFNTPSNDFKDILSLVPGMYSADFKNIQTSGKASFNGFVKGTYNATQMPAYEVNLQVDNASFKYPSLPQAVTGINIKLKASNPDGVPDHTVVNLPQGHLVFGRDPFDFHLLLKTPVSSPWVDAGAKGRLDLSQMQQFMKLESGTKLTGLINADVTVKGPIAAAQKGQYAALDASGTIGVAGMEYASKAYPQGVRISTLMLAFNPKNVTVSNLAANYLGSNIMGSGFINNLLGYYLHNEPLDGILNVAADKVDVNKFMGTTPDKATDASAAKTMATSTTPFIVPSNLGITLNAQVGQISYDNLVLNGVKGIVGLKDETAFLQGVTGNGLEGKMQIDGYYSTKTDKKNPDIQLAYKLVGLDIQQTFNTFITAQKLMPVGKYLSGKITTDLTLKGKLGGDMRPQINTLSGAGSLLLIEGILSKFAPIDQLASRLNIAQLQNLSLRDIKTWFKLDNGRVLIDPFKFNFKEIGMEVDGSHGIDQTIDYALNLAVPRALVGAGGNQLINNLSAQAAAKGLPIKVAEVVNFAVKLGGTVTKPTVSVNLKEVAGNAVKDLKKQIEAAAKARIDSANSAVKDTVKAIKQTAINAGKDALKNILAGNKDSTGNNLQKTGNDIKGKVEGGLRDLFKRK